eukprot:COSAG01_NODE_951_length_12498_cov_30.544018_7_plen_104_part_00
MLDKPCRVPYITEERLGPGKPSIVPKDVLIHSNFFLGNYNAICAIDTDDGSSYIKVYDNVLGYATAGLKSDFGKPRPTNLRCERQSNLRHISVYRWRGGELLR